MLHSKSISGKQKTRQPNLISRTISASNLCKGHSISSQVDQNAFNSSHLSALSKSRFRAMLMQLEEMEEELQATKDKLGFSEKERFKVLDLLEEAKYASFVANEEIRSFQMSMIESEKISDSLAKKQEFDFNGEEEIINLRNEVQKLKEDLSKAEENEKKVSLKANRMLEEMELLKNEWKQAIQDEEKSRKAMEDLALALKEVATESNHVKLKLLVTQDELHRTRKESDKIKESIRSTEEKYKKLVHEAKHEAVLNKNIVDRLRLEADETLLAWNEKEIGFVSCIKTTEDEKAIAQYECRKLEESLKFAENATREETSKLRDILKHAINEANAAKAAAGIARDENSFLKDCLVDKEEELLLLSKENERLRSSDYNGKNRSELVTFTVDFDGVNEGRRINKAFSFSLEDLKFLNDPEDEIILHEDPVKEAALKGSIFDSNAETPKSEPRTPQSVVIHHRRRHSFAITEEFENLDSGYDDSDSEKHSHRRRKTMLRRVGDLLTIRRGLHKKEHSIDSFSIST